MPNHTVINISSGTMSLVALSKPIDLTVSMGTRETCGGPQLSKNSFNNVNALPNLLDTSAGAGFRNALKRKTPPPKLKSYIIAAFQNRITKKKKEAEKVFNTKALEPLDWLNCTRI